MSCPTRPGPKSFVEFIRDTTGHVITVHDWHSIKEAAHAAGIPNSHSRKFVSRTVANQTAADLISAVSPVPDYARVKDEYNTLTRRLSEITDVKNPTWRDELAGEITRSRLRTLKYKLDTVQAQRERMLKGVQESSHTEGNIAVIDYLTRNGINETLQQVRGRSASGKQKSASIARCRDMDETVERRVRSKASDLLGDRLDGTATVGGYLYAVTAPVEVAGEPTSFRVVHVFDAWGEKTHETLGIPGESAQDAFNGMLRTDDQYGASSLLQHYGLTSDDVFNGVGNAKPRH